ncbi:MAG TPA: VWA domain-containing protein [Vicinamibacterales bacterium]|nr:VWA domain-containing protein [Vicinamibacterales bacterium]
MVLAAVAAVAGQAPSRGQPRPPTFRAEVRYVEIDADVTDPQGRFVRGLTRNDFQLFEDGVRQDLVSFRLVDLPIEAPLPPLDSARTPLEPDVTTNTGEGRMYVFLLDKPNGASNIGNDALNARNWARQFIDGSLRPNDIAAVVHVQGNVSDGQPFTSNRRLLEASVERLTFAGSAVAGETPDERIQAIRHSFQAIQDISERLGAVTGRRKAILWINGSVPFDPSEISGDAARQGSVAFMQRDAVRAATRNNVALYAIDPAGLTTSQGLGELQRAGALRALAEETGGEAIVGTNNPRPGIERIVARSSTYYLLGYYPSMDHRDGKFHNVSVRVSRPGLSVRAKKGYYATAGGSAVSGAPRSLADGLSAGGREALRSPAPVRGLDVQLFAAAFRGTKNAASVLVSAQFGGRALRLGANDQVEVSYQPIDRQGKLGKGFRKVFTLNLKPDSRTIAEQSGLRFVDRLELPPGRHELRLAASQPTGSTGSVVAQIEVPDFTKEPLMLSGVVIASRNAGVPQQLLLSEPRVSKTLRVDPTAVRRFTRDDELTAFAEAYVNGSGSPENVEVSYTITSESGAVLVTAPGRTVDDGAPADPRRAAYSGRLPLTVLAPGNYVLLARATARGNSVTRQVPITVVSR